MPLRILLRSLALFLVLRGQSLRAAELEVNLDPAEFHAITFDKIPPTIYARADGGLKMVVAKSSSFLVQAFVAKRSVGAVSFEWRTDGALAVSDAAVEKTKDGDDGRLKIGLMLAGKAPTIPFFASAWIKDVRDFLKLPSDHLDVLIVGTKSPPGTKWSSPYADSMEYFALGGDALTGGWQRSQFKFAKPVEVVGLWLMADGDNTASTFTTWLRNLRLQ